MKDLVKNGVLGECIAHVYVVEYQKRGLPHAHILIWLKQRDKPTTMEMVDRLVTAEIPDPVKNAKLHELVKKHMLHTPCSGNCFDPNANHPCLIDGKCHPRYPKEFLLKTHVQKNKFARLKRTPPKNGGHVFHWKKKDGTHVDIASEWVVEYNPWLLLKYNCHLNIQIVSFCNVIKYTLKYFTKGHDMTSVALHAT